MKLRLRATNSPADEVRRLARRELGAAAALLASDWQKPETVHEARKHVKKTRALLRLVRARTGREFFRRENRALRELGRSLSAVRDAQVVREKVRRLRPSRSRDRFAQALRRFHGVLALPATDAVRPALAKQEARACARAFDRLRRGIKDWPIDGLDWSELAEAVVRSYRRSRAAMTEHSARRTLRNLHQWRKRAKELWYQLLLIEAVVPAGLRSLAGKLEALTEQQGAAHDLDILLTALDHVRDRLPEVDRSLIRQRVQLRIQSRSARAMKEGGRLFQMLPERFAMRLRRGRH